MLFANTEQGLVLIKDVICDMLTGSHLCTVYWLLLSCHFELCLNMSHLLKEPTTSKQKVTVIQEEQQKIIEIRNSKRLFLCTITYIQLRNTVAVLSRKSLDVPAPLSHLLPPQQQNLTLLSRTMSLNFCLVNNLQCLFSTVLYRCLCSQGGFEEAQEHLELLFEFCSVPADAGNLPVTS